MSRPTSGPPKATYADLEALPSHVVGELIGGRLYVSPRPAGPHVAVASALGGELYTPFQKGQGGPGGWWILDEPELHFPVSPPGLDVLVPDLAGWRKEKMPSPPLSHKFTVPPDWVCEILSPSTAREDWVEKLPRYAREGVKHCWYLDPIGQVLSAMALKEGRFGPASLYLGNTRARIEPFEEIELDLAMLWPPVPQPSLGMLAGDAPKTEE